MTSQQTTEELTATSKADWPKNVSITVTLPSGGVAKLKRPDTFALLRAGKVPKNISKVIAKQQTKQEITPVEAMTLLEFLIAASFIDPEVTMTRKAGGLCMSDIDDTDKAAVIDLMKLV